MDHVVGGDENPWIAIDEGVGRVNLRAGGVWTINRSADIFDELARVRPTGKIPIEFDLSAITRLDTAGAWLVYRTAKRLRSEGHDVAYVGAAEAQRVLLDQAGENDHPAVAEPPPHNSFIGVLAAMGEGVVDAGLGIRTAVGFIGVVLATLARVIVKPWRFRWTATVYQMEAVGLNALPIVGLVSFLIGVVIAFQGAYQLRLFGADIFTVNLVVVSVLREFGILLTAIIIAGRSGSAFTAQIGSMKLHEEIDAMHTLAIDPLETLVIPRFVALTMMMPILTFYSDLMGMLGGMAISWLSLGIQPAVFIERAHDAIQGWDLAVGLIKAPVFGMIIALIGCYEGLCVEGSAESVGQHTTRSVVQAIFTIIVLDAFFAIFFTTIGV
ncbi:MAG: MlaE family lipid ABC transporter permease subunit [Proteobacteria bacterium]|nr:MlaE family lipid ABC transporter permease subunit [Pseudomonadota bacterium]